MVMVFRAETLFKLVQKILPSLHRSFQRIFEAIGAPSELDLVEKIYRQIEPVNLSRGFLEVLALRSPLHLCVLPVRGVFWNDLGSERRVVSLLQHRGLPPLAPVYGSLSL
jgi:hypothetical protein